MNKNPQSASQPDPRISYFDHLAPRWNTECSNPAGNLERLEELKTRLGLRAGQKILELGCGTGQITGWLARHVLPGRVVAADFAPSMIKMAKATGADATFEVVDICSETPAGGPFDMVLCFNAFPHFRNKPEALRHIVQSLAPRGILTVLHLAGSEKLNKFHAGLRPPVCLDMLPVKAQWDVLLENAGLKFTAFEDGENLFFLQATKKI